MVLHQSTQRAQRETKMQSEMVSVAMGMGMGFAARWAHEPADPMKTIKGFLRALCGLWCDEIMGIELTAQWTHVPADPMQTKKSFSASSAISGVKK